MDMDEKTLHHTAKSPEIAEEKAENSTIRSLREHIKQLEESLKSEVAGKTELEKRLEELQKAEMTEIERLRKEAEEKRILEEELKKTREESERLARSMETLYKEELERVPEDRRGLIEELTNVGTDWGTKLAALRKAVKLAGLDTPGRGTITQPTGAFPPAGQAERASEPQKYDPKNLPSWSSIFNRPK